MCDALMGMIGIMLGATRSGVISIIPLIGHYEVQPPSPASTLGSRSADIDIDSIPRFFDALAPSMRNIMALYDINQYELARGPHIQYQAQFDGRSECLEEIQYFDISEAVEPILKIENVFQKRNLNSYQYCLLNFKE